MNQERVHRATSTDGTEIVGRVHGQGPPVVFVHGVTGAGDVDWSLLLPVVAERFTCYLVSTRGRGLSADHASHSSEFILKDIVSFIESIGEPAGLVGFSSGGSYVLRAAAECSAVAAVAAYEPALVDLASPEDRARLGAAVGRAGEAIADGSFARCIQEFTTNCVATDEEIASLSSMGYYEAAAPNAPAMMQVFSQSVESDFRPGDPSALAQIKQPTLLLRGTASAMQLFEDAVEHAAAHIADVRVRELPGLGHFAPILHPETVGRELVQFFEETLSAA